MGPSLKFLTHFRGLARCPRLSWGKAFPACKGWSPADSEFDHVSCMVVEARVLGIFCNTKGIPPCETALVVMGMEIPYVVVPETAMLHLDHFFSWGSHQKKGGKRIGAAEQLSLCWCFGFNGGFSKLLAPYIEWQRFTFGFPLHSKQREHLHETIVAPKRVPLVSRVTEQLGKLWCILLGC